MAGNGALLAPPTSNPRLACEDNGCLIFSIRRAQCRILSFTRGGASEVISQRHSARTLLLCGGARTPASAGISRGPGCAAAATSKGPGGPGRLWEPALPPPGAAPPARPWAAANGTRRSSSARPPPRALLSPGQLGPKPPRRPLSPPPHPHFHQDLKYFFLLSPGSQRAKRGRRGRGEGDGSLTQSADLGGAEQMVPLTPAAE